MRPVEPCLFCGKPLTTRHDNNPYGRCDTVGCWVNDRKIIIPLDDAVQVDAWNTRPHEDALETQVSGLRAENERLREALTKADAFLTDYFSPWGSWKTEWWEDVSGDLPFGDHNALKVLEKAIRAALKGPNHD